MWKIVFALPIALAWTSAVPAGETRNVVLIVSDDHGLDAGCYGNSAIRTPNIDRLASQGTRFTNAFCTTSSCSPSRSVLLTGLQNHANGQYGLQHDIHHFQTFDRVRSLPVRLSEAGYRTAIVGKYHLAPDSVYRFDETLTGGMPGGDRNPVAMAERSRSFIETEDDRPFFLYYCTSDPHRSGDGFANDRDYPGVEAAAYDPADVIVPAFLPDNPEVRRELAEYYQSVSRLDQGVGRLLEVLEETGRLESTLVIYLSDNGIPFPGAKTTLYEPGMHLPLIVRAPEQSDRGGACDAMVSFVDVAPTILDYAGVDVPESEFHGRSFLGGVGAEHIEGRDEVYASHTFHEVTMYYPMRAVRTRRHKLIHNLAYPLAFPFASDLWNSATWQGVLRRGDPSYGPRPTSDYLQRPEFELYDLEADPNEVHNLADDPGSAEVLADLKARLRSYREATDDPWVVKFKHE